MTPDRTDDGVLDPEDLVLDPEHVDRIEDNRFIVRSDEADDGPATDDASTRLGPAEEVRRSDVANPSGTASASPTPITDADDTADATVDDPTDALAADPAPHGVDISLKTDGEVARHRSTSSDVREVFADLLTWYANQLDEDATPMEALEVLVATTDLDDRA